MSDMVKVKTMEVRNVEVDIYVSVWRNDHASWQAFRAGPKALSYQNRLADSSTLSDLVKGLKQTLREKAATVKVPFEMINDREVVAGVGRGIHQRDGDVLVTWAKGGKDQIGRWPSKKVLKPLEPQVRAAIAHAVNQAADAAKVAARAQQWVEALTKDYHLDLHAEVCKAVSERAKEMARMEEAVAETAGEAV